MPKKLTEDERMCIRWARVTYRKEWRARAHRTREEHARMCPRDVHPDDWAWWYDHPFRDDALNRQLQVVQRLARERRV
jgi:hypothetical protein